MSKLYWKLRQSMSMASLKQGSVMVKKKLKDWRKPFYGYHTFYPCNRWGVGWHTRGRKL